MNSSPQGRPKANAPPRGGNAIGVSGALTRIAFFGGTFDPVHNAHVELARTALTALQLDQVLWVPAGQPYQKTRPVTPAPQRLAMTELAVEGESRFAIDRAEIVRDGPSYTLDSIRALQATRPDASWFLLIGQDQYAGLHTWRDWPELLDRVVLAVANRPGVALPIHPDVLRHPHQTVPLPMLDISSTNIRARVAAGLPIDNLVPPAVARYIDQHALYGANSGS